MAQTQIARGADTGFTRPDRQRMRNLFKRVAEARRHLEQAVELDPEQKRARELLERYRR